MPILKQQSFNLIPGAFSHNWAVLEALAHPGNEHRLVPMSVSDENANNGEPGSISSCAASLAGKDHFGKNSRAVTKEVQGITTFAVSNPETKLRYTAELVIVKAPGGFDPEQFDKNGEQGLPCEGGPVLLRSVKCAPARINQPKPKKHYPAAEGKKRQPRKWATVETKQPKQSQTVIDILDGKTQSVYDKQLNLNMFGEEMDI